MMMNNLLEETHVRPEPRMLADSRDMPDALVTRGFVLERREGQEDEVGLVLHLLSPRAFELFPEAPANGPLKGLLWFSEEELGNLCAFEEEHDLLFHGLL